MGRCRGRSDCESVYSGTCCQSRSQAKPGQARPGQATIENVYHCLKALCKVIEVEKFKSVALPRLAPGVSGLDWRDVKPLIEKHLGHLSIPLYVYATYQSGVQAREDL
jgi:O-acetyl-ADP-ribose deacetylase (regulator of RNase III)